MELEGAIEKSTMITGGDFHTPRLVTDILSRQKINQHIVFLNSTINQFDLVGIREYSTQQQQNTLFFQVNTEH